MRYRFTDTWASVVVGAGWIVFIGSVFAGIAHGLAREAGIVGAHPFTRFNGRVEELFVLLACGLAGFLVGGGPDRARPTAPRDARYPPLSDRPPF